MPISSHYAASPAIPDLGDGFFDEVRPAQFPLHELRHRNRRWGLRVGLDGLLDQEWTDHFGRFQPLPGNLPNPLALRYHGHQFRVYNPELGDGRGFLFAQLRDSEDGRLLDLATKGSGTTPYSRGGDGRLTLKGGVRELMATEMLEALGVYTSKTFSLIETGEDLIRNDEPSPTRSAVMVRLSHSHLRYGSFQRHAYLGDTERVKQLMEFAIAHYFPGIAAVDESERPAAFLAACVSNAATLAASWMTAGFVHGVLNSDNMVVTGESFDYGPWRFLPRYDPEFTAAYFDQTGLYAYANQPTSVAWNLSRLAQCLVSLADTETLDAVLNRFAGEFHTAFHAGLIMRLGVQPLEAESAQEFAETLFEFLAASEIGFEQFFFDWYGGIVSEARASTGPAAGLYADSGFAKLRKALASLRPCDPDRLSHAYFKTDRPCTMLIDEVEDIWDAIAQNDDWSKLAAKLEQIALMRDALTGDDQSRLS